MTSIPQRHHRRWSFRTLLIAYTVVALTVAELVGHLAQSVWVPLPVFALLMSGILVPVRDKFRERSEKRARQKLAASGWRPVPMGSIVMASSTLEETLAERAKAERERAARLAMKEPTAVLPTIPVVERWSTVYNNGHPADNPLAMDLRSDLLEDTGDCGRAAGFQEQGI